jgi:hypothetical protein
MEAAMVSNLFKSSIYNALSSVEEADAFVRRDNQLNTFLRNAAPVFHKHNLQHRFGVALLHKHSECARTEHMIEFGDLVDGEAALVTRPVRTLPVEQDAVPVVWSIVEGTYHPLEYSTDPLACELYNAEAIPEAFLNDFAGLARLSPVGDHLGLAVIKRQFYLAAPAEFGALEISGLAERSNVVFMRNRAEFKGKSIETAWSLATQSSDVTRDCDRSCAKSCLIDGSGIHNAIHQVNHDKKDCEKACRLAGGRHESHHKPK